MRVTRAEVAKIAGVSGPTVSYVFNKTRPVSDDVTQRVNEAAKKLNYQPDMIARSMVIKETKTIAVLTNDIGSPLQMEVVKGIQAAAQRRNYFVNICGGEEHLENYIDNFIAHRIDGVYISVVADKMLEEYINKLLDYGISVVVTSTRNNKDEKICQIEPDFFGGMETIIEYLKNLKHEKIAYISAFDYNVTLDDRRLPSFRLNMKKYFGVDDSLIMLGTYPYESTILSGYNLTKKLIDTNKEFTAVVCTNDLMAMGSIKALTENGLRVPDDISVVGFDDILFANFSNPRLTTLSSKNKEFGERVFEILFNNMKNGIISHEIFSTELIVRDSCSFAKK